VDLALARHHTVTAFVRSPDKLKRRHERLSVVQGDPLSTDGLSAALIGHDAVLSALGTRPPAAFRRHDLVHDAAASTVAAMTRAGVRRIGLVSAAVLFDEDGFRFAFFRWLLQHIDTAYRFANDALPERATSMSFRAVAAFLLDAVEQRSHVRCIVGLAR
jgi:hypothetical protein